LRGLGPVPTDINFSISAAVGFVSLFGVAIMDGLLLVSYFNDLRSRGLPLKMQSCAEPSCGFAPS